MPLTPKEKSLLRDNKQRGVELLDKAMPKWRTKLRKALRDGHEFNMSSGCNCVLGILVGDFFQGVCKLFPDVSIGKHLDVAADYGFERPTVRSYNKGTRMYGYLETLWREEIKD